VDGIAIDTNVDVTIDTNVDVTIDSPEPWATVPDRLLPVLQAAPG
jgi:hypothetical protein